MIIDTIVKETAQKISLSQEIKVNDTAAQSFKMTSKTPIYANAFIFSCATIRALYGTLIKPTTKVKRDKCKIQLAAHNLEIGMFNL